MNILEKLWSGAKVEPLSDVWKVSSSKVLEAEQLSSKKLEALNDAEKDYKSAEKGVTNSRFELVDSFAPYRELLIKFFKAGEVDKVFEMLTALGSHDPRDKDVEDAMRPINLVKIAILTKQGRAFFEGVKASDSEFITKLVDGNINKINPISRTNDGWDYPAIMSDAFSDEKHRRMEKYDSGLTEIEQVKEFYSLLHELMPDKFKEHLRQRYKHGMFAGDTTVFYHEVEKARVDILAHIASLDEGAFIAGMNDSRIALRVPMSRVSGAFAEELYGFCPKLFEYNEEMNARMAAKQKGGPTSGVDQPN